MRISRFQAAAFAVAALTAVGLTAGSAHAAPAAPLTGAAAVVQADHVSQSLGQNTGGYFLDSHGKAVVNVLSKADAAQVRAAGLTPRYARYSASTLTATKTALDRFAGTRNTSWGIDASADRVIVTIADSAPSVGVARLIAATRQYGSQIAVRHVSGSFRTYIRGGDAIQNSVARCSAGFNVRRNGQLLLLTAGHCTNLGGTWSPINGRVVASNFPGADSGLLTNSTGNGPSQINDGTRISSIGAPTVGESLKKSGSTTGVTSGRITSVNQTVNFDGGDIVYHEFGTTVHSEAGDSGGSGYSGSIGLGTLSGGNSTVTFFYPARRAFNSYGLTLP